MKRPTTIAEARKRARLTQEQLAAKVGVSRGAVAQWEMPKGTYPDPNNALVLTQLLPGLTIETIYQPKRAA